MASIVRMLPLNSSRSFSNDNMRRRSIPRRGQVKAGIVIGLAQSVASVFSPNARTKASSATSTSHF
ncbi:hypothetical protein DCAR_0831427 [Daucus carota subsp. sativus]|uniref:Uncharacterized protein n=1 Tax=Daucus carota subsp. sativus TaxID=79200 RepID=A0A175YN59_DAUCS|nr:hypothetical protein DCAR_0831427 [Daucus carota subsp. sativus]